MDERVTPTPVDTHTHLITTSMMQRLGQILTCSLLILNVHAPAPAAAKSPRSRCVGTQDLSARTHRFQRRYWDKVSVPEGAPPQQDARTCTRALEEMHGDVSARSLAPWRYRVDRDMERYPPVIAFAECLCRGCIINNREDVSYNSVPVTVPLIVLKKSPCPNDSSKYVLTKDSIQVPVACTCVVPK